MAVAKSEVHTHVDPLLLEVADVVNTTLDLDTTLRRVAELVRKVIDYEIFGILLLNEKTQELYFRFSVGHQREVAEPLEAEAARDDRQVSQPAQRAEALAPQEPGSVGKYPRERRLGRGLAFDRTGTTRSHLHPVAERQAGRKLAGVSRAL